MTLPPTDDVSVLSEYVFNLLDGRKADIGVIDCWFSDDASTKLPHTPALTVEPGTKTREYNGAPRRVMNTMDVYIMIYHDKIADVQDNARNAIRRAEAVEAVLHEDAQLEGLVIDSMVISNEPGTAQRGTGGSLMSASRLTFRARSQTLLPYSAIT
jgi:hypothetical protein